MNENVEAQANGPLPKVRRREQTGVPGENPDNQPKNRYHILEGTGGLRLGRSNLLRSLKRYLRA